MYPSEERRKTPDRRQDAITQQMAQRIAELEAQLTQEVYNCSAAEERGQALAAHIEALKEAGERAAKQAHGITDEYRKWESVCELSPTTILARYKEQLAARVAHEVNRAYCQALGDDSQPAWEDAPDWQKESAAMGVAFHLANPDAGPEASHNSWSAQKLNDGWRWGEEKDPSRKTHPCLVAFEALPVAQQAKDYIFRAVVHAILIDGQGGE